MQVVGSSKINNTIYLTVGSVYWTWLLQITGFPLSVTIETALVVIPIAAVAGTVLWAFQIEHSVVERIIHSYTQRGTRGKMIRVWMARTYLIIMPWESSYDIQPTIREMQKREVGRVVKSETLHQEYEDMYQLFWIMAITPPLVQLLTGTILWLQAFVLPASLAVILIIALPVLHRKRGIVKLTLQLAFFRWLHETISRDIENRKTDSRLLLYPDGLRISRDGIQQFSSRIVELAHRKDWDGFTLNVEHFEPILERNLPSYFSEFDYNRVIRYWVWLVRTCLDDNMLFESIRVGPRMLANALETLDQPNNMYLYLELKQSEGSFRNRVKSIFLGIKIPRRAWLDTELVHFEKGVRSLTVESEDDWDPLRVFRIISNKTIRFLEPETVRTLSILLCFFLRKEIPKTVPQDTQSDSGVIRLVNFLIRSIEEGVGDKYLDQVTPSVEKFFLLMPLLAHHWGVDPKDYLSSCGPLTVHCLLEYNLGQTPNEILNWIQRILETAEEMDYNKVVLLLLQKFDDDGFRRLIGELVSIREYGSEELKNRIDSLKRELLTSLNKDKTDAHLHVLRGIYHEEEGRKEMAKEAYLEAAKIDARNMKYLIELGKTMLGGYHSFDDSACQLFKEALSLCEEGSEFYPELADCVFRACTKPSENDDDYDDD